MSEARSHLVAGTRVRRKENSGRVPPAKLSTKALLIEVGEELFGRRGFDGISLREIALAAGQANNAAVHYHFKNKSGLIMAILDDRVGKIEALRCDLLEKFNAGKQRNPRELLRLLWLPTMSISGRDGSYTFCRFLLQHMLHPGMVQHPIQEFMNGKKKRRANSRMDQACLAQAIEQLRGYYVRVPEATFFRRLSTLSTMFLSSVVEYENARLFDKSGAIAVYDIEPVLDMALGALSAPG